jgi:hypothetical protein
MGKQILPKIDFPFKSYDKKLVFLRRMGSFSPCQTQGKKTFLSQSVRSTFAKPFVHVLWQCLIVKNEKKKIFFHLGFLS